MRLDSNGNRRFQFRLRANGSGHSGGTYGSWQEAYHARTDREATSTEPSEGAAGPSASAIREWEVLRYADEAWWPDHVQLHLDALTQLDYKRGLADLAPHIEGVTLAQLESSPLLLDRLKSKIAAAKTYAARPGEKPELHEAAADKPLKILSAIATHAVERQILVRNPVLGIKRFNRPRRAVDGNADAPNHRPIMQSEVKLPYTAALVGSGMRGNPLNSRSRFGNT